MLTVSVIGFAVGLLVMGSAVWVGMPRYMIQTKEVSLTFDETVEAIEHAAAKQGWTSPGTIDLNKSMARDGVSMDRRFKIVQLCKAEYASRALGGQPNVSSMKPCRIAIYEEEGVVKVSTMNIGLMAPMFGGVVSEVMVTDVSPDIEAIIGSVKGI